MIKVVAVSDLHTRHIATPDADLLLVAGDMTFRGKPKEWAWYESWLAEQPQKHKVWIAGNHELGLDKDNSIAFEIAKRTGSIYLQDSQTIVEGVRIWGTPHQPWFHDWAFNRFRGSAMRSVWDVVPDKVDILLTHGPPYGYGDLCPGGERVGCQDMLYMLENRNNPPKYVVCGHIHDAYGEYKIAREDGRIVTVLNCATCDEAYEPTNEPMEFLI